MRASRTRNLVAFGILFIASTTLLGRYVRASGSGEGGGIRSNFA